MFIYRGLNPRLLIQVGDLTYTHNRYSVESYIVGFAT